MTEAADRTIDRIPHVIDIATGNVLLTTLSVRAVRDASFLDERAISSTSSARWVPLDTAPAGHRDDARWIFHIGHCGSTLISRLLDQLDGVLGLREPRSLRDLAQVAALDGMPECPWSPPALDHRIAIVRRLLAQAGRAADCVVVKATSHVSEVAGRLTSPGSPVVLLYSGPQNYLETILAGENSRQALAALSGPRITRLEQRLGAMPWKLWALDEGERIALGWATEMTSLGVAAAALGTDAVLWIDFDRFLDRPVEALIRIASHLGLSVTEARATAIIEGPVMSRYSKAPDHPFDPALRRSLGAEARREHGDAIRSGLAWLAAAARAYPTIADTLRIVEEGRCSN